MLSKNDMVNINERAFVQEEIKEDSRNWILDRPKNGIPKVKN